MPEHVIMKIAGKEYLDTDQSTEETSTPVDAGLEGMIVSEKKVVGWFCGKNFHTV